MAASCFLIFPLRGRSTTRGCCIGPGVRSNAVVGRPPVGAHLNASCDLHEHNGCLARPVRPRQACHPASPRGRMEPQPFVRSPALSVGTSAHHGGRMHRRTARHPPPGRRLGRRLATVATAIARRARIAHRLHRRTERRRRDRHHPRPHVLRAPRRVRRSGSPSRRGSSRAARARRRSPRRSRGRPGRPRGSSCPSSRATPAASDLSLVVDDGEAPRGRRGLHARVGRRRRAHRAPTRRRASSGAPSRCGSCCPPRSSERMPRAHPTADGPCPRHPSPTPRASPTAARCSTSPGTSSPSRTCCGYIDAHRAAEAQRAAPAPHRRPGLAHRRSTRGPSSPASAHRPRWAATAAASTRRTTTAASSSTPPSGSSPSCPRSTCPGTRTRRSAPTPS